MTPGRYRKAMILYYADLERRQGVYFTRGLIDVLHTHKPKRNRQQPKARQERPARKVPKGKVRKARVRP